MENAIWNGEIYIASEVSKVYVSEKEIRRASKKNQLRCPDPDCLNPILVYRHGKIKKAHFAHKIECECEYLDFDHAYTNSTRAVKDRLYRVLKEKGFDVLSEVKALPHHFTHLLVSLSDNEKFAIEIGTKKTGIGTIDFLTREYNNRNIAFQYLIVDEDILPNKDNETFFLNRYALHESRNNDAIIIDWNANRVIQYTIDSKRYRYNGVSIQMPRSLGEYYYEKTTFDRLTIENGSVCIEGFGQRYREWLEKKEAYFQQQSKKIENEKTVENHNVVERFKVDNEIGIKTVGKSDDADEIDINRLNLYRLLFSDQSLWRNGYLFRLCLHCKSVKKAKYFSPSQYYLGGKTGNFGRCKQCSSEVEFTEEQAKNIVEDMKVKFGKI